MAQSVPSSSLLPCIRSMPAGWAFERMVATDRGARFWLRSDRDGARAVTVIVNRDRDLRGAAEQPTEQPGARRYDRGGATGSGYRWQRYYLYSGGCITYDFNLRGNTGAGVVAAVSQALGFVSRDTVAQLVHENTDGRLPLDPPPEEARS